MDNNDNRIRYIYEYDPLFKRQVLVAEGECLVCKHCTDMFYDDSNGPYMACCELTIKTELGNEALSNFKEYGVPCSKYEYDGIEREIYVNKKG